MRDAIKSQKELHVIEGEQEQQTERQEVCNKFFNCPKGQNFGGKVMENIHREER